MSGVAALQKLRSSQCIRVKPMAAQTIDEKALPVNFPTHRHDAAFWERLGRTVATYGFLEEILGKAIFSFTATKSYEESEIDLAYEQWLPKLERALTDSLGNLIDQYEKAVREHPDAGVASVDDLLGHLRMAAKLRNVLCHGSWPPPDENGAAIPKFVDQRLNVFDTPIDHAFLDQVQRHVAEVACAVMNSVAQMGWQFPGTRGRGSQNWHRR